MIECEVMGFGARPYDFNGRQGTSYKISVSLGDYPVDNSKNARKISERELFTTCG